LRLDQVSPQESKKREVLPEVQDTHNTNECRRYDKDGKPTGHFGSKTSEKHKPFKKGGEKGLAYMTSMLEAIAKGQKRAAKKGKKRKKHDYNSSSDSDSE
jgi:hypothetical protein